MRCHLQGESPRRAVLIHKAADDGDYWRRSQMYSLKDWKKKKKNHYLTILFPFKII